jgi:triosephosphate isomerase
MRAFCDIFPAAVRALKDTRISVGRAESASGVIGAYTGEVSAAMLKEYRRPVKYG